MPGGQRIVGRALPAEGKGLGKGMVALISMKCSENRQGREAQLALEQWGSGGGKPAAEWWLVVYTTLDSDPLFAQPCAWCSGVTELMPALAMP